VHSVSLLTRPSADDTSGILAAGGDETAVTLDSICLSYDIEAWYKEQFVKI
jgi:hypothetical protein